MKIFRAVDAPPKPGDPKTFTGAVRTSHLASDGGAVPTVVYRVEFEPGARTFWHTHSGPQWLFVVEGRVRVRTERGEAHELGVGDAVVIAPGERHWHGAAPGWRAVHIAININARTEWLEPVSETDYNA